MKRQLSFADFEFGNGYYTRDFAKETKFKFLIDVKDIVGVDMSHDMISSTSQPLNTTPSHHVSGGVNGPAQQ